MPSGTKLTALSVTDGKVTWEYSLEEQHGPLKVPCRIQGIQLLPRPVVKLPGISPPPARRGSTPGSVCIAGQAELHCLSLPGGRRFWKALKDDGCILSLHKVGDVDTDGVEDLVSCGCNFAECFSGRTGADLWREPVSGRSLWAGPCGDLNGDGLGEVLLQAGTDLRVMSATRPGRVTTLFKVDGFLPRVSLPRNREFLVGFGGASAWLWTGDGKGRKVWDAKAHLIDAYFVGGQSVIATKQGIWVELEDGRWKIYQTSDWHGYRWEFGGRGSLGFEVRVGSVERHADGRLTMTYRNGRGSGRWVLDPLTLRPLADGDATPPP